MEGKTDVSYYLIVGKSLTQAQKIARTLERAGIPASVSRLPRKLAGEGCGFCVKIRESAFAEAMRVLGGSGMTPDRAFFMTADGGSREVPL